jgi:general secretion pathway protein G
MTTRLTSSFPIAPAVLVLLSACGHHETSSPPPSAASVAPVEPATAPRPPPTPVLELAKPPADPVPAKKPEADAAKSALAPSVTKDVSDKLAAAKLGRVKVDIVSIESALENYAINNSGRYPDTLEPLVTPDVNGATYLRAKVLPKDAWDRDYLYDPPSPGNPLPKIYSLGRDGRTGGTGEDADVDNISIRNEEPR